MKPETTATLKDIATAHPAAARVFEFYHLDYCCGGKRTLGEACRAAGLDPDEVATAVGHAQREPVVGPHWEDESLTALIRFIVDTHHVYTRTELARIEALLAKVGARHGAAHPELGEICECFDELKADLRPHLFKEEQVLFPYIEALEAHRHRAEPPPESCFGSIANPIRVMTAEHDAVGELLKQMRRLTVDYTPPADPCPNYRALYAALDGLETDLLRHIHLENNILFPRARELAGST